MNDKEIIMYSRFVGQILRTRQGTMLLPNVRKLSYYVYSFD